VLQQEISEEESIKSGVTGYFSADYLEPEEHQRHDLFNHSVNDRPYRTKANVEVTTDSNWENGEAVVERVGERLKEFGPTRVGRANADLYEPLSELGIRELNR